MPLPSGFNGTLPTPVSSQTPTQIIALRLQKECDSACVLKLCSNVSVQEGKQKPEGAPPADQSRQLEDRPGNKVAGGPWQGLFRHKSNQQMATSSLEGILIEACLASLLAHCEKCVTMTSMCVYTCVWSQTSYMPQLTDNLKSTKWMTATMSVRLKRHGMLLLQIRSSSVFGGSEARGVKAFNFLVFP